MKETSKIYTDIESLLDIRAGTLSKLVEDKNKLIEYLNSEEYNFREIDHFSIANQEDYNKLCNNRTIDIISSSVITYIINSIKSKLVNLERRNNYYNEKKIPEVIINVYPFNFNDNQRKSLQNITFVKLKSNTNVEVVNIPIKELTPCFINSTGITTCFIYNFKEWMNCHINSLENNKLTNNILYFPALYYEDSNRKELETITKLGFKDIFSYTEYIFSNVANISFLPVVFYSNIITASSYLKKLNRDIRKEETNGNISTEI